MKAVALAGIAVSFIAVLLMPFAGCKARPNTLWDLKCASCHDGKTVLNDQVAPDRQDIIDKYTNMEQFMLSCMTASPCMSIFKHDEEIFREVGRELGIPEKNAY
jgi:hypothetical protein